MEITEPQTAFQSTPSAWRETPVCALDGGQTVCKFQSTPSAWRETDHTIIKTDLQNNFNPLPPHGGRPGAGPFRTPRNAFQSTPSAWRETNTHIWLRFVITISIHSLRMEGDERPQQAGKTPAHFNPLPPHGGRHYALRGIFVWMHISIHSLRMEGDRRRPSR